MTLQSITIRRPDDWHVHLRDGEMLDRVARYTARQFARAIVMPNLVPPVTSVDAAAAYRDRILAVTSRHDFTPLMTCYLTDNVDPDELARGYADGVWVAAKLYPAGATTNSASGVTDIRKIYPVLEAMQRDANIQLAQLKVDGGAAANNLLLQFQADVLGVPVRRPLVAETTALGAAYLAGLAVGYWKDTEDVVRNWALDREFAPAMPASERDQLYATWQKASTWV